MLACPPTVIDIAWVLICMTFVIFMQADLTCLESGLVRAKNSINVAIKNLTDVALSAIVFWTVASGLMFGASAFGFIGTDQFFSPGGPTPCLMSFFLFQLVFCGTATTIVPGAVAERMRFSGYLIVSPILSMLLYPIMGHWM